MTGLSVVIPHYGDPAVAGALVAAVRQQETQRPIELIVVDDASPRPFPRTDGAIVRRREHNGGFGAAANTGIELASHDLVLLMNSDLEIGPGFIERVAHCAEVLQPAVVGPRILRPDGTPVYSARRFPRTSHFAVEFLVMLARFRHTDIWHQAVGHDLRGRSDRTFETDWLLGAALVLPREEVLAAGGFDTRYHMNSEEVDLALRLRRRGVPSYFLGGVTCRHVAGSSSGALQERHTAVWRARLLYVEKWRGVGARRRTQLALATAAAVNALWQTVRRLGGRDVRPFAEARRELRLLRPSRSSRGATRERP